jgi:hypothetical protein
VQDNAKELSYNNREMMGPVLMMTTIRNKRWKTSVGRPRCSLLTYQRIMSKFCQWNPSRYAEEEVVSVKEKMDGPNQSNDKVVSQARASDATTNNYNKNKENN